MEIHVKLMGLLQEKSPERDRIELSNEATIEEALKVLDIPEESVQVFTVNGQLVRDRHRRLEPRDELVLIPAVSGG